jgi:CxxC motif-containing protein (DUF1111 family)
VAGKGYCSLPIGTLWGINFTEMNDMKHRLSVVVIGVIGLQIPLWAGAAQQPATEAPAGFDTPTLIRNPGSKSVSDGIAEPTGDNFALDQQIYETQHDVNSGLGPVFNGRACAECHQNPVSGGASQFTELRVGHLDANGNFVNPIVTISDGAASISGRSIINDRAVVPEAQEHIPVSENIRALRAALNTLGDGFVEAIDDSTLLAIAARQPEVSGGRIHGEAIDVPVLEAPGQSRIGRFGWKDQHSSLLSFIGDAYLNEMGVTNRLRPKDETSIGKVTPDPEDVPDALGLADIDHFAQFVRGTKVPPRDTALAATPAALAGEHLFDRVGCGGCHVSSITTAPPGTVIDGGTFAVPVALGNKIIHPYGDFLLHDVGTGDGIVQAGPQDTANKLRTAALWGLRMRPRYMHDLRSLTLQDAIERHDGEAKHEATRFRGLSETEKQQLLSFLESL